MDNNQRRIGVLLPPGNVSVEREFARFAPDGVAFNYNRLSRPDSVSTKSSMLSMVESLERTARDLAQTNPELMLFACTSGSFLEGRGKEDQLARRINDYTGVPAIPTSMAVVDALSALGLKRVYLITPYPDEIDKLEQTLGCAVVTSNQATLWAALRFLGVPTGDLRAGMLYRTAATAKVNAVARAVATAAVS